MKRSDREREGEREREKRGEGKKREETTYRTRFYQFCTPYRTSPYTPYTTLILTANFNICSRLLSGESTRVILTKPMPVQPIRYPVSNYSKAQELFTSVGPTSSISQGQEAGRTRLYQLFRGLTRAARLVAPINPASAIFKPPGVAWRAAPRWMAKSRSTSTRPLHI